MAHTKYYNPDGDKVPSVTTIIDQHLGWNKRILQMWYRKECLAGRDPLKTKQTAADIGTAVHDMIERCILGQDWAESKSFMQLDGDDVEKAMVGFNAYQTWAYESVPTIISTEVKMVGQMNGYWYGGTCDLMCEIGGDRVLLDFKTSKSVYPEYIIQLGAYSHALTTGNFHPEASHDTWEPDRHMVLHIDKLEGTVEQHYLSNGQIEIGKDAFGALLELNDIKGNLKI